MIIQWEEVQRALSPVKSYEDLYDRFRASFAFPFVRETFNASMEELIAYTRLSVGSDSRGRYGDYTVKLLGILKNLRCAGVKDILDLVERTQAREGMEAFAAGSGVSAVDVVQLLKFLIYWYVPGEKYLSGLIRNDAEESGAVKALSRLGIRTNLQLLQEGFSPAGRKALAERSGLPEEEVAALVHRADLSRMPWSSKATISNILGAGYASLAQLAEANPQQLYVDFFAYGRAIGKNLKLGNEIDNSYRIARILPRVVRE